MKKNILLFFAVLIVAVSAYLWTKGERSASQQDQTNDEYLVTEDGLTALSISTGDEQIKMKLVERVWWIISPEKYPANQELVEKALSSMTSTPVQDSFDFKVDHFGFAKPKAFCVFTYNDGLNLRYTIGDVRAPGNGLYVLDKDSQRVSVVHNLWGQFFYYPYKELYHPGLPLSGHQLKSVTYRVKGKVEWSVKSSGERLAEVTVGNKSHSLKKAELLWFFNLLREIKLKNLLFNSAPLVNADAQLDVETDEGNIIFDLARGNGKIWVPSLNVFADLNPFSLTSLTNELNKAVIK